MSSVWENGSLWVIAHNQDGGKIISLQCKLLFINSFLDFSMLCCNVVIFYNSVFCSEVNAGLGLDSNSLLRWGLGAIIIMLIVSTAISIGQKVWPNIKDIINSNAEGRSLDDMSMTSLAQYAFEAFEKYQALNEERN